MMTVPNFCQQVFDHFGNRIRDGGPGIDMHCIKVSADHVVNLCRYLKTDPALKFDFLSDLCGVDYHPNNRRFEVVYHLYSIPFQRRLRVKCRLNDPPNDDPLNDGPPINKLVHAPTVTGIWRTAAWHERETFDMFGIIFDDHPDMRRIYMWDEFEGYPMRKDFPLRGYKDAYNPYGEERGGEND